MPTCPRYSAGSPPFTVHRCPPFHPASTSHLSPQTTPDFILCALYPLLHGPSAPTVSMRPLPIFPSRLCSYVTTSMQSALISPPHQKTAVLQSFLCPPPALLPLPTAIYFAHPPLLQSPPPQVRGHVQAPSEPQALRREEVAPGLSQGTRGGSCVGERGGVGERRKAKAGAEKSEVSTGGISTEGDKGRQAVRRQ